MKILKLHNRTIKTENPAFIMGIVNCTPDSFYAKSRIYKEMVVSEDNVTEAGVRYALDLVDQGADILDLGGESTRPGSDYVDSQEEIRRLIPIIRGIRKYSDIPISIDTRKAAVFKACFEEGADILNDVSALEDDIDIASYAAQMDCPVILMHKRGIPKVMQQKTSYSNVFEEVNKYFESRIDYAISSGIKQDNIIIDPGIGFGKDLDSNRVLIARVGELCDGKYPVLMALSRKTCIGEMTGRNVEDRLYGTLAADMISVMRGASIVRVHDVAPCWDTLAVLKSLVEYL